MNRMMPLAALIFSFLVLVMLASLPVADEKAAAKKDPEAKIKAAFAKLPESDRKLAVAQRYCVSETESRLGSMGVPVKLEFGGKTVFLCCEGCRDDALADPKATLAQAEKLKKVTAALGKLRDPDRTLAEQQRFCPVLADSRLGSMGVPVKLEIKGKPVFLCCEACREEALDDPAATLKKVEDLKKPKGK